MKKLLLLIGGVLFFYGTAFTQINNVDSLHFSTEKGLLIFEGYLNGVKTDFAFDTGAAIGVLNSKNIEEAQIVVSGSRKVRDSQKKSAKVGTAEIENLKIGSFNFSSIVSVVTDMPFLHCNKTYLLGGDVINKLNWKFDFKKNVVYFSKTPFLPKTEMLQIPYNIIGNRHFADLNVAGISLGNVLVDFGYVGNCTININSKLAEQILQSQTQNHIYKSQSFSMGLNSISKGKITNTLFIDSILFGGHTFDGFEVNLLQDTDQKIGLYFIRRNASEMIINSSERKYWLLPATLLPKKQANFDANFYFNDNGKIEVVALNNEPESSAKMLTIGEEVRSLNGRLAGTFADRCAFMAWTLQNSKLEEVIVEKLNGDKVVVKKSIF